MGWFTKKNTGKNIEKKPELPELPNNPNADFSVPLPPSSPSSPPTLSTYNENKIPNLPQSLPQKLTKDYSTDFDNKLHNNEPKQGMQKSKFAHSDYKIAQDPEHHQPYLAPKQNEPLPYPNPTPSPIPQIPLIKSYQKKDDSIFIKLDKFQITMEAFGDINQKITEIENLLNKTKEVKAREEKELEDWEREIEAMKIKLDAIGKEITGP